ncbi:hypothetical protein AVEN_244144-1 [Araneus ventricosus]|uniref:Uncharacterized protein n=1 Tax=Araneus ventricosus TaxID=182803 RepID=A0A4Y2G217_ARAVE|nr:hypothetical protein AVEN_244144-1 [Araneus ventricosus]
MPLINFYIIFAVIFAIINVSREQSTRVPIQDAGNLNLKTEVISNRVNNPVLQPLYKPETTSEGSDEKVHEIKRYPVASFDFDHVAAPFIITAWIFVACGAKIGM